MQQALFMTYWFVLFAAALYPLYWFVPVRRVRLAILLAACVVFHTHFAGPAGVLPIVVLGLVTYLIGLTRLGEATGALSIAVIAAIVLYDVIVRALGYPTLWALEFTAYVMVGASVLRSIELSVIGDHQWSRQPKSSCARSNPRLRTLPVGVTRPS